MQGDFVRLSKNENDTKYFPNEELEKPNRAHRNKMSSPAICDKEGIKGKLRCLLDRIKNNMGSLEESVKISHHAERMIFQNEIQLLIDRQLLDFELDREKCKTERLKRMNSSDHSVNILSHSDQNEIKYLRKKCQNLTLMLKKRSNQMNKALVQIKDLKNDKENLKSQIKDKDTKIKAMFNHYSEALLKMNEKVGRMKEEACKEKRKSTHNNLQIALQEQIKQNKQLVYNNCQLKNQITQSKTVDRFNIATQVTSADISKHLYYQDVSG